MVSCFMELKWLRFPAPQKYGKRERCRGWENVYMWGGEERGMTWQEVSLRDTGGMQRVQLRWLRAPHGYEERSAFKQYLVCHKDKLFWARGQCYLSQQNNCLHHIKLSHRIHAKLVTNLRYNSRCERSEWDEDEVIPTCHRAYGTAASQRILHFQDSFTNTLESLHGPLRVTPRS